MVYEKRTVISQEKMEELIAYFEANSEKKETEKQIIYNYHTEGDLRLIKTNKYLKIDFKPSKAIEKENNVYIKTTYADDLTDIFTKIGMNIELKRYRIRYKYMYQGLFISIDNNIKTGNIFRIKFHYQEESEKQDKQAIIDGIFNQLEIPETDLSKFNEIYAKYRMDWAELTKDIDEVEFLK